MYFEYSEENIPKMGMPLLEVCHNLKDVTRLMNIQAQSPEVKNGKIILDDKVLIFSGVFSRRVLLKKEQWTQSTDQYRQEDRYLNLVGMYANPLLYKIFVVPYWIEKNDCLLHAVTCLSYAITDEKVGEYLTKSDIEIHEKAKYAALYDCEGKYAYYWKTGKKAELLPDPAEIITPRSVN